MFLDFLTKEETNEILNEMGSSDFEEFKNRLEVLYFHMLKYQYQSEIQSTSWVKTINEQYKKLIELLCNNNTLKNKMSDDVVNKVYDKALKSAVTNSLIYQKRFNKKPKFPCKLPNDYYLQNILYNDNKYIYIFLEKYKYTQEVINYLDIMSE